MIARIFLVTVLAIVLPDLYIYLRYVRRPKGRFKGLRLLWWLPSIVLLCFTVGLSLVGDFVPKNMVWLNVYLFFMGIVGAPKLIFVFFSLLGLAAKRIGLRRNWGEPIGIVASLAAIYVLVVGSFVGTKQLELRHVDLYFDDMPAAFEGYRLVQFTDIHIGSIDDSLLRRAVNAINSEDADMAVFTGDIQNVRPQEMQGRDEVLRRVRAKDGVFAVLGNHDYSMYMAGSDEEKAAAENRTVRTIRSYGWQLLSNEHRIIERGGDAIVIAGEENDGKKPFPQKADIRKTLEGAPHDAFIIMLQHDPSAWRRSILPDSEAQLTLSGHTHGGQISLFGWRPTQLTTPEDCGLYTKGDRKLYVSSGLGGVVPFRFGVPPEIVVFTLHRQNDKN